MLRQVKPKNNKRSLSFPRGQGMSIGGRRAPSNARKCVAVAPDEGATFHSHSGPKMRRFTEARGNAHGKLRPLAFLRRRRRGRRRRLLTVYRRPIMAQLPFRLIGRGGRGFAGDGWPWNLSVHEEPHLLLRWQSQASCPQCRDANCEMAKHVKRAARNAQRPKPASTFLGGRRGRRSRPLLNLGWPPITCFKVNRGYCP